MIKGRRPWPIDVYRDGVDDGSELMLVKLIERAEQGLPMCPDDLRKILARLVAIRHAR